MTNRDDSHTQGVTPTDQTHRTPPHVSLRDLRAACGLTLDDVLDRMRESTGVEFTRGSLSKIESGVRGASPEVLQALAVAYGLRPTAIRTDYRPVRRASVVPA